MEKNMFLMQMNLKWEEMKDPEFAKEVYDFLESELSSWEFKDFIKLRENRNDGYNPTELEQGKEK